jgi:hypothetical protein
VTTFLRELASAAVVIGLVCIAVRWVLPTLLRMALAVIEDGVDLAGACLLLPEYWVSTNRRRRSRCPHRLAYEYAAGVAGLCRVLHMALRRLVRGLVVAAHAVPAPLVAVTAGGAYLVLVLR